MSNGRKCYAVYKRKWKRPNPVGDPTRFRAMLDGTPEL